MNCWFGSSRTTSIDGSASRTYFAAVAPPQPPPITTTRRPALGAKSPLIAGAHPAARNPNPAPAADVLRNSLRVNRVMTRPPFASVFSMRRSQRAESAVLRVPGRAQSPRRQHEDHEAEGRAPTDRRRQEHGGAELPEDAGLRRHEARQRTAEGEASDRRPELHLALARAPDRARTAAAGQRHPDAEHEAPAERPAEEQEDALRHVAAARVDERRREQDDQQQRADPRLPARPRGGRRQVHAPRAARPLGPVLRLPDEVAEPEKRARAETEHHAEARERERARRREKAPDVAAEGEDGTDAHQEPAATTLQELAPRRHAYRELPRQERRHEAAQEDARVQQRPRVEPRGEEIGAAHDPEARQDPVAPVPHAVRRGPRPVKGEQKDVERRDEDRRSPDGPGTAEEHRVLRRERAAHAPAVTSSVARRTGRRPPTPPAPRSGAPTASRTPRGPPPSLGRSPAARSPRRAGPS